MDNTRDRSAQNVCNRNATEHSMNKADNPMVETLKDGVSGNTVSVSSSNFKRSGNRGRTWRMRNASRGFSRGAFGKHRFLPVGKHPDYEAYLERCKQERIKLLTSEKAKEEVVMNNGSVVGGFVVHESDDRSVGARKALLRLVGDEVTLEEVDCCDSDEESPLTPANDQQNETNMKVEEELRTDSLDFEKSDRFRDVTVENGSNQDDPLWADEGDWPDLSGEVDEEAVRRAANQPLTVEYNTTQVAPELMSMNSEESQSSRASSRCANRMEPSANGHATKLLSDYEKQEERHSDGRQSLFIPEIFTHDSFKQLFKYPVKSTVALFTSVASVWCWNVQKMSIEAVGSRIKETIDLWNSEALGSGGSFEASSVKAERASSLRISSHRASTASPSHRSRSHHFKNKDAEARKHKSETENSGRLDRRQMQSSTHQKLLKASSSDLLGRHETHSGEHQSYSGKRRRRRKPHRDQLRKQESSKCESRHSSEKDQHAQTEVINKDVLTQNFDKDAVTNQKKHNSVNHPLLSTPISPPQIPVRHRHIAKSSSNFDQRMAVREPFATKKRKEPDSCKLAQVTRSLDCVDNDNEGFSNKVANKQNQLTSYENKQWTIKEVNEKSKQSPNYQRNQRYDKAFRDRKLKSTVHENDHPELCKNVYNSPKSTASFDERTSPLRRFTSEATKKHQRPLPKSSEFCCRAPFISSQSLQGSPRKPSEFPQKPPSRASETFQPSSSRPSEALKQPMVESARILQRPLLGAPSTTYRRSPGSTRTAQKPLSEPVKTEPTRITERLLPEGGSTLAPIKTNSLIESIQQNSSSALIPSLGSVRPNRVRTTIPPKLNVKFNSNITLHKSSATQLPKCEEIEPSRTQPSPLSMTMNQSCRGDSHTIRNQLHPVIGMAMNSRLHDALSSLSAPRAPITNRKVVRTENSNNEMGKQTGSADNDTSMVISLSRPTKSIQYNEEVVLTKKPRWMLTSDSSATLTSTHTAAVSSTFGNNIQLASTSLTTSTTIQQPSTIPRTADKGSEIAVPAARGNETHLSNITSKRIKLRLPSLSSS
ncbi:unnamed protein product [Anisakis simplex]|uniref:ULP_PROTEASE domain-containing protein n=1 Tax=Anisakis simplex TaxID=6269 RepID=A0A0M3JUN0_ANISI|nr:unnamed protein product [Anisakis simplex]